MCAHAQGIQVGSVLTRENCFRSREPANDTSESSHDFYEAKMAEGLKIDPRTAYVMKSYAQVLDPYGIEHDLPGELQCIGSVYFARAPGSDDWVISSSSR